MVPGSDGQIGAIRQILAQPIVVKVTQANGSPFANKLVTFEVTRSGWYQFAVEGNRRERFPLDASYAQAFTNPVWVTVGGKPPRSRASAEYGLRWIEKLRAMAEAHPGWRSQAERDHVFSQFAEAEAVYRRFALEADR